MAPSPSHPQVLLYSADMGCVLCYSIVCTSMCSDSIKAILAGGGGPPKDKETSASASAGEEAKAKKKLVKKATDASLDSKDSKASKDKETAGKTVKNRPATASKESKEKPKSKPSSAAGANGSSATAKLAKAAKSAKKTKGKPAARAIVVQPMEKDLRAKLAEQLLEQQKADMAKDAVRPAISTFLLYWCLRMRISVCTSAYGG